MCEMKQKLSLLGLTWNLCRKEEPSESEVVPVRQFLHSAFINSLMSYL